MDGAQTVPTAATIKTKGTLYLFGKTIRMSYLPLDVTRELPN